MSPETSLALFYFCSRVIPNVAASSPNPPKLGLPSDYSFPLLVPSPEIFSIAFLTPGFLFFRQSLRGILALSPQGSFSSILLLQGSDFLRRPDAPPCASPSSTPMVYQERAHRLSCFQLFIFSQTLLRPEDYRPVSFQPHRGFLFSFVFLPLIYSSNSMLCELS